MSSKLYCYKCQKEKDLTDFKIKANGFYPKNCTSCLSNNFNGFEPMSEDEENILLGFLISKKGSIIVYKSIHHWCRMMKIYRGTITSLKKDIDKLLSKNKIRKKEIIHKGNCSIYDHKVVNVKAFKI